MTEEEPLVYRANGLNFRVSTTEDEDGVAIDDRQYFKGITNYIRRGACLGPAHYNVVVTIYACFCSFTTYLLIYGFRKPWSSSGWKGQPTSFGFDDPKLWLDFSQTTGYTIGKFLGVFVVPSIQPKSRFPLLFTLPLISSVMWLSMALLHTEHPLFVFFTFFFTSMPLSWGWSLIYRFIEGRASPDIIGAAFSVSYILGSAVAKAIGKFILDSGISRYWMPIVTCCIYLPLFMVVAVLTQAMPAPSMEERAKMRERKAMTQREKWTFFSKYWIGFTSITVGYMVLTSARDFRDTFQAEIWLQITGKEASPTVFFLVDVPVAFLVCAALMLLHYIHDNRLNVLVQHLLFIVGYGTILTSHFLFKLKLIPPEVWYVGVGLGIYLAYTPVGAMFYDRLNACLPSDSNVVGTASFMIQVSDFTGYVGTIAFYLFRGFFHTKLNYGDFYSAFLFVSAVVGAAFAAISALYFWRITQPAVVRRLLK